MKEMKEFNVLDAPLSGVHLVEANAGTGKTWNIEALVIRLLIEKELEPSQVLVVTFTDAAAQELRERVLDRINQVYSVLNEESYSENDPFLLACFQKYRHNQKVMDHLELCKSKFDEASIYTIHSFCKQVLTDFRFEAGLETEMQIIPDSRVIQQEVITDEWRYLNHRFSKDSESQLADILYGKLSLTELQQSFRTYASGTGIRLDTDADVLLAGEIECVKSRWTGKKTISWSRDYVNQLNEAIQLWADDQDEIRKQWLRAEYRSYNYSKNGEKWENDLQQFLQNPMSSNISDHVSKFTTSFLQDKPLKKDSTSPRPKHPFFDTIDFLFNAKPLLENQILRESCERMKKSYMQKRQQQQVLIFDDLLAFTERALNPVENAGAHSLTAKLREKYPAALIDEFQDTDHTQFSIFRRIYIELKSNNLLLYMIGDPKQSIYLFRGADLKTYFKARNDAEYNFTLAKNFRSTEPLIQGVNAVFGAKHVFLDDELTYNPSTANKLTSGLKIGNESTAPARFINIQSRSTSKISCETAVMKWVVTSISRILSSSGAESTIIDKKTGLSRRLNPGDIAILVSKHDQSRRLKHLLAELGIPAVESGDSSVFLSEEAGYLNLLLDVVLDPRRIRKVKALLTTPMFGLTSDEVRLLQDDETEWSLFTDSFRTGEQIILKKGILAGLRYLFDKLDIEKNLVKRSSGERSITNLRHLSELLHVEEESQRRSLAGLSSWLLAQRSDGEFAKSDDKNMRLETDDERVHIMTMHSSKGLQFPIVYAPFLWTKAWGKKSEVFYVKSQETGDFDRTYDPYNRVYPFGSDQGRLESLQDRIRLLYVTLTRAEERFYVPFTNYREFKLSPLYIALVSSLAKEGVSSSMLGSSLVKSSTDELEIPTDWDSDDFVAEVLSKLAKVNPSCIHFEQCDSIQSPVPFTQDTRQESLNPQVFSENHKSRVFPSRMVSSYSSIQRKYGHEQSIDGMQNDEHSVPDSEVLEPGATIADNGQYTDIRKWILNFPKGSTTGNYWHELLELVDFSNPSTWDEIVNHVSDKYGYSDESYKENIQQLIQFTVDSPIGKHEVFLKYHPEAESLKLSELKWSQTRREMEFLYPYSANDLQTLVNELNDSSEIGENVSALANINVFNSNSLLTGLVDLIFEYKGKYFILDYKSNHLGSSLSDYSSAELSNNIRSNGYNLQYHLYTAALSKYLDKQINGFSYDLHFGGVFYLYWRGLNPDDITGVYFDKPNWEVVKPLMGKIDDKTLIFVKANISVANGSASDGGKS
jgi:exodeoxyribonuclease V beta subunit